MTRVTGNSIRAMTRQTPLSNTATVPGNFSDTRHLRADLKRRSVRGGAVAMTAQIAKLVLQTASTVAVARLLTPHEFGLVAGGETPIPCPACVMLGTLLSQVFVEAGNG